MANSLVDVIRERITEPAIGELPDRIQDAVLRQDLDWIEDQSPRDVATTVEMDWPIPIIPGLPGQQVGTAER